MEEDGKWISPKNGQQRFTTLPKEKVIHVHVHILAIYYTLKFRDGLINW